MKPRSLAVGASWGGGQGNSAHLKSTADILHVISGDQNCVLVIQLHAVWTCFTRFLYSIQLNFAADWK